MSTQSDLTKLAEQTIARFRRQDAIMRRFLYKWAQGDFQASADQEKDNDRVLPAGPDEVHSADGNTTTL